jgi:hypothetical protein
LHRHGIPAKVDLGDKRGIRIGAVHLDLPDEPLQFPCYALFLDPAKALIIKGKDLWPYYDDKGNEDTEKLVPKDILTMEDINWKIRENPELKTGIHKKINGAVRIGVGAFVEKIGKPGQQEDEKVEKKYPRKWDPEVYGELKLENVLHVEGDESWGSVTKEDQRVWVTIF